MEEINNTSVYIWWVGYAILLVLAASGFLGNKNEKRQGLARILNFLIEERKEGKYGKERMSLTKFQTFAWTITILSLIAAVYSARLFGKVADPQVIAIPNEVLILMGISLSSATLSTVVKANKDSNDKTHIHAGRPKFSDLWSVEEGQIGTSGNIALEKFQNFWFTILLLFVFISSAANWIGTTKLELLNAIPPLDQTWNTLLGISHAAYIAIKVPDKPTTKKTNK